MIDFTNRETLITVKVALIRAMNSLDNEIEPHKRAIAAHESGRIKKNAANRVTREQHEIKLRVLTKSRDDMILIYREIDDAIRNAG